MTLLMVFLITILAVMIIYRRRKLQHLAEIDKMNERFTGELLQAQMEVQQETMQYIGREIHDNIGQKLTLAVLYVQQLDIANSRVQEKVDSIAAIINESLADPKMQQHLTAIGNTPLVLSPEGFAKLLADETEKWGRVVKFAGIKAD